MDRGTNTGAGLLSGLERGPTLEESFPDGLSPVQGTQGGAVSEKQQCVGRTHTKIIEEFLLWEIHHTGEGKESNESSP